MEHIAKYDRTDPKAIEAYAKRLIGLTFRDIINLCATDIDEQQEMIEKYAGKARKGGFGNFIEEAYFGYKANSDQNADFKEAGVELKVSPYEKNRNGELRAGERLVITMISYSEPFEEDFYKSHVWEKIRQILLIYYFRNKAVNDNLIYKISFVNLFSPPRADLLIIQQDYEIIKGKIIKGCAHELSESDTMYLGACTKGSTAASSIVPQYYNKDVPARKRAFCFKTSYMTYVLNHYIVCHGIETESLIKEPASLAEKTFEEILYETVNQYVGRSDRELCEYFGYPYNNNKAQWATLSYRILGIKSNRAAEFEKANISVRAVRIESDGRMKENMSFAPFEFKKLAQEEFEDSELYRYFYETRLFFVVWKKDKDVYRVAGSQLWNMPYQDLERTVRDGWKQVQRVIKYGVKFRQVKTAKGYIVYNNLPKKNDNEIIHIRPHADKAAYRFADGTEYGNVARDANELPNGEYMTTQSFWINNSYIIRQLNCLNKRD